MAFQRHLRCPYNDVFLIMPIALTFYEAVTRNVETYRALRVVWKRYRESSLHFRYVGITATSVLHFFTGSIRIFPRVRYFVYGIFGEFRRVCFIQNIRIFSLLCNNRNYFCINRASKIFFKWQIDILLIMHVTLRAVWLLLVILFRRDERINRREFFFSTMQNKIMFRIYFFSLLRKFYA